MIWEPFFRTMAAALFGNETIIRRHRSLSAFISRQAVTMLVLSCFRFFDSFCDIFCFKIPQTFSIGQKSAILGACRAGSTLYRKQPFTAAKAAGQRCMVAPSSWKMALPAGYIRRAAHEAFSRIRSAYITPLMVFGCGGSHSS